MQESHGTTNQDHDSPWKEALEAYFPEFLALLFPTIHAQVDWSREHTFLDKELQQIVRDAEPGRRYADKLVAVATRDGSETWVLIHVEVQGDAEHAFAERMYVYHYRLTDRYGVDVVSLAVLADDVAGFRPRAYHRERWGCEVEFRFPMVKLLDWEAAWPTLVASDNVFALVVMAQLRAKTERDVDVLAQWKFRLVRLLYERGYGRDVILELFRVMDWMIRLPESLEEAFRQEVYAFEEAKRMPYITSVERAGIEKGRAEGLRQGMEQGIQNAARRGDAAAAPDRAQVRRIRGRKLSGARGECGQGHAAYLVGADPDGRACRGRVRAGLSPLRPSVPAQAGPLVSEFSTENGSESTSFQPLLHFTVKP